MKQKKIMRTANALFIFAIAVTSVAKAAPQTKDYVTDHVFLNGSLGIEGPAVDKDGNLYAVSFSEEGAIGIIDKKDNAKLFSKLPAGSKGNGIRFDRDGMMYVADYTGHNVLKINPNTKEISVYGHSNQMDQPNDIAITSNGIIYASDPNWKASTGRIWKVDKTGNTTLVAEGLGTTNGIEVSTDEKHLYFNESVQRKVWQFDIDPTTGNLSNKKLLIEFADFGLDGMRCDIKGNLYIARYNAGEVAMVSPEGKLLKTIKLKGGTPTNVAFGGKDGKTVFVTIQERGNIEYFTAKYPGREWMLNKKD
jgi:sugar lactone lactonase YvrE